MEIILKDADIEELLAEVQRDLDTCLQSQKEKLAKSEMAPVAKADEDEGDKPPVGDSEPSADSAPPSAPPTDDAPPAAAADVSAEAAVKDPDDGSGMDLAPEEMDPEALQAELSKMPVDQVKMIFMAVKNVLMGMLEHAAPEAGGEMGGAAPAAPPAAPPTPAGPPDDMTMKSEDEMSKAELEKSQKRSAELEERLAKAEKYAEDLKVKLDRVTDIMTKPIRRGVTSAAQVENEAPTVVWTREKAIEALNKKIVDGKIEKSEDKDLIVKFSVGMADLEDIKDLLK